MLPTLVNQQLVMAAPLRLSWNQLQRGDIVVFHSPVPSKGIYIKRIVGLPDEYIELKDGKVFIDSYPLQEDYPVIQQKDSAPRNRPSKWHTDTQEYFVLGDNRSDSGDSRLFGPIDRRLIIGRVWLRCWPLKDWKLLPR